jgi:hypothetical protein
LCQVKEVVERQHQRKKKDGWEREKENMKLAGCSPGEGRGSEVDLAVPKKNVGQLLAELDGCQGGGSGAIREPSSGHDCRGLYRQIWQGNKHIIRDGGDAEA